MMTPSDKEQLLAKFKGNPPASGTVIRQFETESHIRLPDEYAEFLHRMNGGQGFVGNAYVILWRIEELVEINKSYRVAEFAPGLFLFGSDGGGEAFAFDLGSDSKPIVSVPFIPMELKDALPFGSNFNEFLETLFIKG